MTILPVQDRLLPEDHASVVPDAPVILTFDVEEHDRIEAAAGLVVDPALTAEYRARLGPSTYWLIDQLAERDIRATFFIVGRIAEHNPGLIRAIHRAGHEVAAHGWDHQRVHNHTPEAFRNDVRLCKDALEQVIGEAVVGYRAPTFSVVGQTAWAIDVLTESGMLYDSSIYPIRHDRYGVPGAPRSPFLVRGFERELLELPPATLRVFTFLIPVGGGGYFRLLPLSWMERAIAQLRRTSQHSAVTLYFHPWEFDPAQPRLPLPRLSRFRTYTGIEHTRERLQILLARHRFARAVDVAREFLNEHVELPRFSLASLTSIPSKGLPSHQGKSASPG
jgi:polysaccharide deacetylase family protein (PEP-CTERM system associated)